MMAKVLQH